ncbi:MAG: dienelactone hydrolase family protein [Hormoscilla sp. GUM202]|nr:dienelactone hydrolase family protein [Hormoscilla sp. GUM202]
MGSDSQLDPDHGFCCDHRSSYNHEAATDAWKQVQQLFQQELQAA